LYAELRGPVLLRDRRAPELQGFRRGERLDPACRANARIRHPIRALDARPVHSVAAVPAGIGPRSNSIDLPTLTIVPAMHRGIRARRETAMDIDMRKLAAEAIGTFWLTFGGCGSAVLAAAFPQVGIGLLGVSLAFGLTVLTMAYSIGHVSGCHLNPAVTVGLAAGGRFPSGQVVPYVVAQVVGAVIGAAVLYVIASGKAGFSLDGGFAANGYGEHSPGKYGLSAGFLAEAVVTAMFLFVIMGATHGKAPAGFAPIAIGLALTLIHLI